LRIPNCRHDNHHRGGPQTQVLSKLRASRMFANPETDVLANLLERAFDELIFFSRNSKRTEYLRDF
jgi:hypothetical protein